MAMENREAFGTVSTSEEKMSFALNDGLLTHWPSHSLLDLFI